MSYPQIDVYRNIRSRMYELVYHEETPQGICVGMPVTITMDAIERTEMSLVQEPTLQIPIEAMDSLLTQMWRQGSRPEGWQESVPALDVDKLTYHVKAVESLERELERERQRTANAEDRLDRALELLGMEPTKRRVQVRRNHESQQTEEDT